MSAEPLSLTFGPYRRGRNRRALCEGDVYDRAEQLTRQSLMSGCLRARHRESPHARVLIEMKKGGPDGCIESSDRHQYAVEGHVITHSDRDSEPKDERRHCSRGTADPVADGRARDAMEFVEKAFLVGHPVSSHVKRSYRTNTT